MRFLGVGDKLAYALGAAGFVSTDKIEIVVAVWGGFKRIIKIKIAGCLKTILWVFCHIAVVKHKKSVKIAHIFQNIGVAVYAVPLIIHANLAVLANLGDDFLGYTLARMHRA